MKSLDGVVKIVKTLPAEVATGKPAVIHVPNRVTEDFIRKNIKPIFRTRTYLRLAIVFPSINMEPREKQSSDLHSTSCLAMFDSLELKPEVQGIADAAVDRLRTLGHKSDGKFVAVDLRVDDLDKRSCKETGSNGEKRCHNVQEVNDLLKTVGFDGDTTIYLTQTWWHNSLNLLREDFPKIYTKDDIIPPEKKGEFLRSGNKELERALDFHVCTQSDVFVPAIYDLFYGNVAGKRIGIGKTQILCPQVESSSNTASDYLSTFVSKKNHWAYSCFC